jgi:hypothetical protein
MGTICTVSPYGKTMVAASTAVTDASGEGGESDGGGGMMDDGV